MATHLFIGASHIHECLSTFLVVDNGCTYLLSGKLKLQEKIQMKKNLIKLNWNV